MSKHVRLQKLKVIRSKKDASNGEYSPYWNDVERTGRLPDSSEEKGLHENPIANPDMLPETEIATPSTPQLLMGEAISHLQGRQKEVYLLLMRESKTYEEVSEVLGIARGAVQTYERRAIKFISAYCAEAIKRGRV